MLLALGWGWSRVAGKRDATFAERDKARTHLTVWSVALGVQLAVLAYVWCKTPANRSLFPRQAPLAVSTFAAQSDEKGNVFYKVILTNTSDVPLTAIRWVSYPQEGGISRAEWLRYRPAEVIPVLAPRSWCELPRVFDRGWTFEFDCGEMGKRVYHHE
jgi:hypothetical protein